MQADVEAPTALGKPQGDKGCHSKAILVAQEFVGIRGHVCEWGRGPRSAEPDAWASFYANLCSIRGIPGKALLRSRGECLERAFAHVYNTGGTRRPHLRKHDNILKRLLVHVGGFTLGS